MKIKTSLFDRYLKKMVVNPKNPPGTLGICPPKYRIGNTSIMIMHTGKILLYASSVLIPWEND